MRSCSGCSAGVGVSQIIFPSARFRQRRWRLRFAMSPGSREEVAKPVKAVMKILLPKVIGLDAPGPGIAVFQTIFLSSPQVSGAPFTSLRPCAPCPRNCGQSLESCAAVGKVTASKATRKELRADLEPGRRHRFVSMADNWMPQVGWRFNFRSKATLRD